ncbi:TauD/TfdA family dioxygenase [Kitasatospora acidiphila]|uniref:TauD/TfdA family dioxygenase n=1 Tax=Kitasatospora acidiphila TaxID=2567942 RepID=A0A540WGL2_9ACTN|nr:TauD/TfdA family dioxygenase [Kitasatospora acidiphila]TQF08037.1 TauD/TfdA family dioxygenase [Kitasatospora acidiphila]
MFDDTVTDVGWDAAALNSRRDLWLRELTDEERQLLWSDALAGQWTDADRVRKALHAFVLDSSRTVGFAHVRNLADPAGLGDEAVTAGLSFLLRDWGVIVPQNSRGELAQVLHDRDGDGATELGFHCDACDLLVLLCLRPAARGGGSTKLASARQVYDVIERERPAAIAPLREPWLFDRSDRGGRIDVTPIFFTQPDGLLGCHYQPRTVRASAERLSAPQREALDLLDEVLHRPETAFGLRLAAGELLVIRNSRALHGRSPFTDEPGARSRRMLRIWLSEREAS